MQRTIDSGLLWVYIQYIILPIRIMPNLDGTGPMGQGSLTGKGTGQCAQQNLGRGFFGRGKRCGCPFFWRNASTSLEEQEKFLEEELKAIREERAASSEQKN